MDLADSGSLDDSASTIDLNKRPSNTSGPKPKLEILDDFKIESELGHGGMGEVYLATERGLNRQVALKVLPAANRISARQVQRFLLEAKAAAQLSHDHIVPIYHVGECGGVHYFTMRYIEGYDLAQIIRSGQRAMRELTEGSIDTQSPSDYKPKSKSGKSGESTAKDRADSTHGLIDFSTSSFVGSLRASGSRSAHKLAVSVALIGQAVADALQHAHEHGIVHRDIKPSNLMLDNSNKVWVTDFGLAQLQDAPGLTNTGEILGTLRYMSPEQASARPAFIDHRTDIYSLGVTLYELATLQKACRGESAQEILRSITFERPQPIRKINPKLPRDLETIIFKATERNPSDRYQSAAELAADLRRFANSESLMARRPSRLKNVRNWIWDRPAVSAMALAMLIVFAGSMLVAAVTTNRSRLIEEQRADEAVKMLTAREAQQLIDQSLLIQEKHPSLAVAAAQAGGELLPGPTADSALMAALDLNHELDTLLVKTDFPGKCVASNDGQTLILCCNAYEWQRTKQHAVALSLKTRAETGVLRSATPIIDAAFSRNDDYLLTLAPVKVDSGVSRAVLELWNSKSLQPIKSLPISPVARIGAENFSKSSNQLVVPNDKRSATLFDLASLQSILVLPAVHEQAVIDCKFNGDGSKIVTWSLDKSAIVWDSATGAELQRITYKCTNPLLSSVSFTSDSSQLCISGDTGTRIVSLTEPSQEFFRLEQVAHISASAPLVYLYSLDRSSILVLDSRTRQIVTACKNDRHIAVATSFTNDKFVATVSDDVVNVFSTLTGEQVASFRGHQDFVESITAMPGEGRLVSYGWDGTVRHWSVESDRHRRTFPVSIEAGAPVVLGQSLDGAKTMLGNVRESESTLRSLSNPDENLARVEGDIKCQLPNGQVLTSVKGAAVVWDLKTQRKIKSVNLPSKFPGALWLAEGIGEYVGLVTPENKLYSWNLTNDKLLQLSKGTEQVFAIAKNGRASSMLVGLATGELFSVDLETGERTEVARFRQAIRDLDFQATTGHVLVVCSGNAMYVKDLSKDGNGLELTHPETPISAALFVSNDRVISYGGSKGANLWATDSGALIENCPVGQVFEILAQEDGMAVAIASEKELTFWDFQNNTKQTVTTGECRSIAFAGNKLVFASQTGTGSRNEVSVWDRSDGNKKALLQLDQTIRHICAEGLNDQFIISTFMYGADIFNVENNQSVARLSGHRQPLILADFTSEPDTSITLSKDGQLKLHRARGEDTVTLAQGSGVVSAAALSNDRKVLLVADDTGKVLKWDLLTRRVVAEKNFKGDVTRLVVSNSNKVALAVIDSQRVVRWDLANGIESDYRIDEGVRDVTMSPDGTLIVIVPGKTPLYPAHPAFTVDDSAETSQPSLTVIKTAASSQEKMDVKGLPTACQFVDGGRCLAILTSFGHIQVYDGQDLKFIRTLETNRRFMQILTATPDAPWIIASAKEKIVFWKWQDGSVAREITTSLSEDDAALRLPKTFLVNSAVPWYLLYSNRNQFTKVPTEPMEYAKKIAPRRLSDEERKRLLNGSYLK